MHVPPAEATTVHRDNVDGVPTFWSDLSVDPVTTLFFGVGYEDTAPRASGITHLVEHLVMRRVGRVRYTVNAESTRASTSFFVVGTPGQTVDFLARVCAAVHDLADVQDSDLETERRTILAEIGTPRIYAASDPLSLRFGPAGAGANAVSHARLLDWSAAEVRDVAARWFHAGNAALTSTRALPEGLRLDLPAARPVVRAPHPPARFVGRVWTELPHPVLHLSGRLGTNAGVATRQLAAFLLADVLTESVRSAKGEVYSVQAQLVGVDAEQDLITVDLDPEPDRVAAALDATLEVVDRLAEDGPTPDELDHTRDTTSNELTLASTRAGWLDSMAIDHLRGLHLPDADTLARALTQVTTDDVRATVAEFAASMLVSLPAGPEPVSPEVRRRLTADGLEHLDAQRHPEAVGQGGRAFRGKPWGPARWVTARIDGDRFSFTEPGGGWSVRASDVVLAGTDVDGDIELVTCDGETVLVVPRHFFGLSRGFSAFLDQIPEQARYVKSRKGDRLPARDEPAAG